MLPKKVKIVFAAVVLLNFNSPAQLTIQSGATFHIESGAVVTVQGDVLSSSDITGTGKVLLKGSSLQNVNMNNFIIPNLEMDNSSNAQFTGSARITGDLLFTNGKILLGANNITMGNPGTITGSNNIRYLVTDGTGRLNKTGLGGVAFIFPVGNSTISYNPVTISNSGTVDEIGVRALSNVYSNGLTGTPFVKEVADVSWDISEASAGGSNLSLTTNWFTSDELPGFVRNKSGISYYIPTPGATQGWDLLNNQTGTPAGSGTNPTPYNFTRNNITSLGAFAVGFRPVLSPLLVTPKIYLQGPLFNSGTTTMDDNLRLLNKIPGLESYTGTTGFLHTGSGGGETADVSVIGSGAPVSNNAVTDWVFVQLHNAGTGVVETSRSALIQRDGDIVDTDGVSPLNMAGNAVGNYYLSIRHRNHLNIRSTSSFGLLKTVNTSYNFTDNINKALNSGTSNAAMATMPGGTVYGMWGGNANDDIVVKMTGLSAANNDYLRLLNTLGSSTNSIPNTYSKQDLNMDGTVKMTGLSAANNDYLKLLTILGSSINTITQTTF